MVSFIGPSHPVDLIFLQIDISSPQSGLNRRQYTSSSTDQIFVNHYSTPAALYGWKFITIWHQRVFDIYGDDIGKEGQTIKQVFAERLEFQFPRSMMKLFWILGADMWKPLRRWKLVPCLSSGSTEGSREPQLLYKVVRMRKLRRDFFHSPALIHNWQSVRGQFVEAWKTWEKNQSLVKTSPSVSTKFRTSGPIDF